ncbi:MAG: KPN_02809 family neutral zinc metallopeptidase [Devosia sp.]|jgi:predicted metalloprotease|nr:neutral zinc metallopeptidase [Devosia sp.]HVX81828.1 neutral zinc metallopeptidase [Devosiaceae bacterium]
MKTEGREQSTNIEDRRGQGGFGGGLGGGLGGGGYPGGGIPIPIGGRGGVSGIVGIVIILVICWALGINPLTLLDSSGDTYSTGGYSQALPGNNADQQKLVDFVGVVVKDTENYWGDYFQKNGKTYVPPKIVLFTNSTQSGCGTAQSASGPFYCPDDQKVYLDLGFYDQLRQQFGAPGDFAQAYVIAHEIGHRVQDLMGTLGKYDAQMARSDKDTANAISVRIELQADCYAGVWANYEGRQDYLDNGDVEEAINAANQIGDDTLQRKFQGTVQPRSFTHGTSAQRMKWFKTGAQSGDPASCDTFSGNI